MKVRKSKCSAPLSYVRRSENTFWPQCRLGALHDVLFSVKGLNPESYHKQAEYDRPGERSPEQDCCNCC